MTSQINSLYINIDEAYPVAGVDNDTQGFRDNFDVIKSSLAVASSEITELQDTTAKINAANNFAGNTITNAILVTATDKSYAPGVFSDGVPQLQLRNGGHQRIVLDADDLNIVLSWKPTASLDLEDNRYGRMLVEVTTANAQDEFSVVWASEGGGDIRYNKNYPANFKVTIVPKVIEFTTYDGGQTVFVSYLGEFLEAVSGPESLNLDGLSDVIISNPSTNQTLLYNGTRWVNSSTTANISAETTTGGANLRLTTNGTDDVKFESGYGINVTRKDANTIRIDTENFKEYSVRIADDGSGTQEVFFIDDVKITNASLKFTPGFTYRFKLENSSNSLGPLRFSTTPDTAVPASITPYTTGVTIVGTAGTSNSYIEITVTSTTPNLYLYGDETGDMIDTSKLGGEVQIPIGGYETKVLVRKNYTAISNQQVIVDSSSDPFTVTLPENHNPGDFVSIVDNGNATNNPITIDRNNRLIDGTTSNLILSSSYSAVTLVSDGTNWIIQTALELADSQDLQDAGTVDTRSDIIYFTTVAAETATLAAGSNGEIKTFAMLGDGGDMVITVSNAGWKSLGTGTMTFDNIGDACTLQYIVNKWVCIGNNGVTFA